MFCTNCGASIVEGGRFCTGCGTPVAAPEAVQPQNWATPVADTSAQQQAPVQQEPAPVPEWKQNLQAGATQAASAGKQLAKEAAIVSKRLAKEVASSEVTKSSKSLFLQLLKNPAQGLEAAYEAQGKIPHLILGVFSILVWILFINSSLSPYMGRNSDFALFLAVAFAVFMFLPKIVHAIVYSLCAVNKKGFFSALTLVFAGTIYESLCLLLMYLMNKIGLLGIRTTFLLLVATQVFALCANYQEAVLITGKNRAGYLVPVVTTVVAFVPFFIAVTAIESLIKEFVGELWSAIF